MNIIKQKGFTLIELLSVVAIIGVLATMSLPLYQDYVKRSYASEGLVLAASAKSALVEYYSLNSDWPQACPADSCNEQLGLPPAEQIRSKNAENVTQVSTSRYGVVVINYSDLLSASKSSRPPEIWLKANTSNPGSITWECSIRRDGSSGLIPTSWVPPECRNTCVQINHCGADNVAQGGGAGAGGGGGGGNGNN